MTATFARIALAAIVLCFAAAEIARPTTFVTKRSAHALVRGTMLGQPELDDLPPIVMPAIGNIDETSIVDGDRVRAVADTAILSAGAAIRIVGWCADPQSRLPGSELIATVDRTRRIDLTSGYRIARPDVATYYHSPQLLATGFSVELSARTLGSGDHAIAIAVVTSDGGAIAAFPTIVNVRVR